MTNRQYLKIVPVLLIPTSIIYGCLIMYIVIYRANALIPSFAPPIDFLPSFILNPLPIGMLLFILIKYASKDIPTTVKIINMSWIMPKKVKRIFIIAAVVLIIPMVAGAELMVYAPLIGLWISARFILAEVRSEQYDYDKYFLDPEGGYSTTYFKVNYPELTHLLNL